MSNNKKLCTLYDDGDANLMLLSDDQIAIICWLADRGYEMRVEIMPEKPEEVTFEEWKNKVIR